MAVSGALCALVGTYPFSHSSASLLLVFYWLVAAVREHVFPNSVDIILPVDIILSSCAQGSYAFSHSLACLLLVLNLLIAVVKCRSTAMQL